MKRLTSIYSLLSVLLFTILLMAPPAYAKRTLNHSSINAFLSLVVNEAGEISYQKAIEHKALLEEYLMMIKNYELKDYQGVNREERLALWLNVYHAALINVILEHYPIKSINEIPGVWEATTVQLAGTGYSLNHIRDEKLMRVFRDEKIHLALACGAKSCPGFKQAAYTGDEVEGQLFLTTREFVNNPKYVRVIPGEKKISLSRLFKWYAPILNLVLES